jgi:hypothetical protein
MGGAYPYMDLNAKYGNVENFYYDMYGRFTPGGFLP